MSLEPLTRRLHELWRSLEGAAEDVKNGDEGAETRLLELVHEHGIAVESLVQTPASSLSPEEKATLTALASDARARLVSISSALQSIRIREDVTRSTGISLKA